MFILGLGYRGGVLQNKTRFCVEYAGASPRLPNRLGAVRLLFTLSYKFSNTIINSKFGIVPNDSAKPD